MANLDTRSKRASSVGLLGFALALPLPDATIAQADRAHIAFSYSAALVASLPPAAPGQAPNYSNDPRLLPTLIIAPEYDRIRAGDRQALEDALRSIVNTTNSFILRKGG